MIERKKQQMTRDKVSRLVNWGHWFAFFNGILAMLIGARYIGSVGYPETIIGWAYLTISTIGHFTFLAFIVYLIFIFPITLLLPYSKILRGYAAFIASLGLYALLYDTIIYDDYGIHLSPFAFDLAWQDLNALLHSTSYIVTPIVILLLELTAANFLWKRIDKIQKKQWGNKVVLFVGICFVSSHLFHIFADATNMTEVTRFDDIYPVSYPATARSFMENHGIDSTMQITESRNTTSRKLSYPISPMQCMADSSPNILIISIDGLRADMVDKVTMPFLSEYRIQNQRFMNHYSGGTQFNTSMFTLLYGLQGNYSDRKEFSNTRPILTDILTQQGYQLAMFAPKQGEYNPDSAMFNGFNILSSNAENGSADADVNTVNAVNAWRPQQSSPWLALVNLTAPKDYDTPVGFLGVQTVKPQMPLKPAQKVLFNQYRQSLNFIDQQLAALLADVSDETLVLVTGTYGQVFTSNTGDTRNDLSPSNVKVPLIIHWPGNHGSKINYRTSHYGIAPTLLSHVLGCTNPSTDYSSGRSLLEPNTETWVYIGDSRRFAIYQKSEITVLDRFGKYRIYDIEYKKQLKKKMSAPELIQVMREGRRLYNQ
jgi:membrane-anchored protein YejM (alkaline phosphatase superfamily)